MGNGCVLGELGIGKDGGMAVCWENWRLGMGVLAVSKGQ